jgi:NTE family protein
MEVLMLVRISSIMVLSCLVMVLPGVAEEPQRPRIGLVLSGGGALGTAHVGVIKVLEELQIPIDYVAGTSMGAIVGGLYASGLSPAEMEQALADIDWHDIFDDLPPRREMPFRRKQDDLTYLTRFEIGFNHGSFQIPPALVFGQKFGVELQRLTLRAAGIQDFDQLPIPFRAVATDIETGDMVVLSSGDLGRALRASMAVPGVFSPIEIDGRLLVDGGLVRNLPVDVVREMGAEVVIAVDVGEPLYSRDELRSMLKVTSQVINMQLRKNVEEQVGAADFLIKPDLGGFSSAAFEKYGEMIPRGEAATRVLADQLQRLTVPASEHAAYRTRLRHHEPLAAVVESVQLSLESTADPELVLKQVRARPGDRLDVEAIRLDLQRLYQLGDYERVDFMLLKGDQGYHLIIEAHEKSWGPNLLRFGLNLSADMEGESAFNMLATYTMTGLNRLRGEAKLALQLGEDLSFFSEYYQPLSLANTWFVSAWAQSSTSTVDAYVTGDVFARYRVDTLTGGLDLGLQLGKYGEVRLGLNRGLAKAELRKGPSLVPEIESEWSGYRLSAIIDQLDYPNFPRNGYLASLELLAARDSLGSDETYNSLIAGGVGAFSYGRHTTMSRIGVVSAMGSELPVAARYSLGGLFQLSGYPLGSISGQYGGLVSVIQYYRLLRLPSGIGEGVYVGASVEAGNLWETQQAISAGDLHYSGAVFIGADTAFGPVYLASGHGEGGQHAWYIYVGRTF